MNKKIFLFFVLSLINNNLLYGDNTEKIILSNCGVVRKKTSSTNIMPQPNIRATTD